MINFSLSQVCNQPLAIWQRLSITLVMLLLVAECSLLTVKAESPNREQRLAVFDEVWQTINKRYYDAKLHGVDWRAQRKAYRTKAAQAASPEELYSVLRKMIGALRDSHTRVYAPKEKSDWRNPRVIGIGVSVREIENELVVVTVSKFSAAHKAKIKVGDVVAEIDGVAARTMFERRLKEHTGASTEAAARLKAAAGIFEGSFGSSVRLRIRNAKNRERSVSLEREWRTLPTTFNARRENSILIVDFDAFTPETARQFFQMLGNDLDGARGMVLDLRANRGGSAEAMIDVASAFLPRNHMIGNFFNRAGKSVMDLRARSWLLHTANIARAPELPIVVLTSTATASAAEIFTAALKQAGRARVIGTSTCGCVLAVKGQHSLPDGGVLEFSEFDFQLADGARLEGVGIKPDEKILLTRRDLLAHRDPTLEHALEILKEKRELGEITQ